MSWSCDRRGGDAGRKTLWCRSSYPKKQVPSVTREVQVRATESNLEPV